MGSLRRVRAAGDRDDPVGPDPGLEGRQHLVGHIAAGGRVAADEPDVDISGGRVGEIGQAAVPVPVVRQDGPGSCLVQLGDRLGLGRDVALGPVRILGRDGVARLAEVIEGALSGSEASSDMRANGMAGGSISTIVAGTRPAAGRPAAVIAPQL